MITCPNCNSENGDLVVICGSCGGFVQARVPTLDLFNTIWQLIERPRQAMRKIALADHKNCVILLSGLYGMSLSFFFMWFFGLGRDFINILYLIFAGLATGPPIGLVHIGLIGVVVTVAGRLMGIHLRLIDVLGVAAYSTVPIIFALVFILPVEILTFGLYLFDQNPSPFVIKPVSYVLFLLLDGITVMWSIVLFTIGLKTLGGMVLWKSLLFAIITLLISFALLLELIRAII